MTTKQYENRAKKYIELQNATKKRDQRKLKTRQRGEDMTRPFGTRRPKGEYELRPAEFYRVVNECRDYEGMKKRIRDITKEILEIENRDLLPSGIHYDGMPHSTNVGDPVGESARRALDHIRRLEDERTRVERSVERIEAVVEECCDDGTMHEPERTRARVELFRYMLKAVTMEGASYKYLFQVGIPMNEKAFYQLRRKIYYRIARG